MNNGVCKNTEGGYECLCGEQFTGENCDDYKCSCLNGGECFIEDGSFVCDCTGTGYTGTLCTDDIDECKDTPCIHGSCINSDGSYSCICNTGYDGHNCSEETEYCNVNIICLHGGICYDKNVCKCTNGWSGERCDTCDFEVAEGECLEIQNDTLNQQNNSSLTFLIIGRLNKHKHDSINFFSCSNCISDRLDCYSWLNINDILLLVKYKDAQSY